MLLRVYKIDFVTVCLMFRLYKRCIKIIYRLI